MFDLNLQSLHSKVHMSERDSVCRIENNKYAKSLGRITGTVTAGLDPRKQSPAARRPNNKD